MPPDFILRGLLRGGGFASAGRLASVGFAVGVLEREPILVVGGDIDIFSGSPVEVSGSMTSTTSPPGATTS
jgi:hypothetical protein